MILFPMFFYYLRNFAAGFVLNFVGHIAVLQVTSLFFPTLLSV